MSTKGDIFLIDNNKKYRAIHFRISEDDFQKLEKSAKLLGFKSANLYVKNLAKKSRTRKPYFEIEEAKKIEKELRSQGNNLNQISKLANLESRTNGNLSIDAWRSIYAQIKDCKNGINKILSLLKNGGRHGSY